MPEDKRLDPSRIEQRSMGTALAAVALTGATAGSANALANHALNTIRKPKDESPPKQQPKT